MMMMDYIYIRANGLSVFSLAQFTTFSKGLTWYFNIEGPTRHAPKSKVCLVQWTVGKFITCLYVFMRWIPVLGKSLVKCLFRVIIAGHLWVGICGGKCPRRTWMLLKTLIRPCLGKWVHNFGGNFQGNVWGNFQVNVGGNFQGNVRGIV